MSFWIESALESGTISLDGEEDLDKFVAKIPKINGSRSMGINFKNVGTVGKNTIEFRLANGTVDPNVWIENINLFGGIVRSAHELSAIQQKPQEQRTQSENRMLECFEIISTSQDQEEVAKALIDLCISPEQRQIYMNRYTVNNQLLLDKPQERVGREISQMSTKKIGKKVFTGQDAISGPEYQFGAAVIDRQLEPEQQTRGTEQGG